MIFSELTGECATSEVRLETSTMSPPSTVSPPESGGNPIKHGECIAEEDEEGINVESSSSKQKDSFPATPVVIIIIYSFQILLFYAYLFRPLVQQRQVSVGVLI